MPNKTQNNVALFQTAILRLFESNRTLLKRKPGGFEIIPNKTCNPDVNVGDMRVYIDEEFKAKARKFDYEYIVTLSTENQLVFLDTIPVMRQYSNMSEKVTFAYDYDKKKVVEIVIQ